MLATFRANVAERITRESFIMAAITYLLIVVSLLLNSFTDSRPADDRNPAANPSRVLTASPPLVLLFDWATPLIAKGYRNAITSTTRCPHSHRRTTTGYGFLAGRTNWRVPTTGCKMPATMNADAPSLPNVSVGLLVNDHNELPDHVFPVYRAPCPGSHTYPGHKIRHEQS
ncbi:canalicular multispecific organic anion transporter 1-like [Tropilaelaps mercedesae]|uniref:Canalicular multispecific organic anion transporter 1-like n=1 Tax=Tropilaelaps mercedesae TaxID=418985 RepID=A0A1V9X806_9ACAR|nr:canalicular multispecific organic anion transporter 1-like [Tropilaelaps mercedesae]